jgi:hypothetical protein
MASGSEGLTRHDLEAKIVKRCWEDDEFRKEFIADPNGVFVNYLRIPAASLPKIAIHQETPGSWHIVLPAKPANPSELSEQDLEKVAGGTGASVGVSLISLISAVSLISFSVSGPITLDQGW